jgi:RNA polymerase sigma factor (sigma-70 family)
MTLQIGFSIITAEYLGTGAHDRKKRLLSGSITHWLDGLKAGESLAAQELWNRYFSQLVAVAQSRLRSLSRETDGEDIALSALKSAMLGIRANRYPQLIDRTGLWPLLVTIAARKSIDETRRQLAVKRSASTTEQFDELRVIVGQEPSPVFAIQVADELERLVTRFDDPSLRAIAQRKLEGFTHEEIAEELSMSVRTVIRKLNRIRQEWTEGELEHQATS